VRNGSSQQGEREGDGRIVTVEQAKRDDPLVTACDVPFVPWPRHGWNEIAIEDGGAPIGARKLRALHAAAGRLINRSPPKAASTQPAG